MTSKCNSPVDLETLLQYWLGELEPVHSDWIDEHILSCGHCSAMLAQLAGLSSGIGRLLRGGDMRFFVTLSFVDGLKQRGLRVREYVVAHNGSVNCAVSLADDFVVARLQAPLQGVTRLDVVSVSSLGGQPERIEDVPFDAASGEVVVIPHLASLRQAPDHQHRIELIAREGDAERTLGHYVFFHSAH